MYVSIALAASFTASAVTATTAAAGDAAGSLPRVAAADRSDGPEALGAGRGDQAGIRTVFIASLLMVSPVASDRICRREIFAPAASAAEKSQSDRR
jgi:hypothetical protein